MSKILFITSLILILFSCSKKEDNNEVLSSDPKISFVSITPQEVENFNNSISLVINYKDNNGDLGFDDPDEFSLWVKDSRLDSADYYHIPPLAPLNKNLVIQGKLEIVLNSIFILGNGNEEVITLSIKLRDRANHWSNIVTTPTITIKR